MEEFKYEMKFKAKDKAASLKVMKALVQFASNVAPEKLEKLGNAIERDPGKADTAIKWL